jgi:hypothetical protein
MLTRPLLMSRWASSSASLRQTQADSTTYLSYPSSSTPFSGSYNSPARTLDACLAGIDSDKVLLSVFFAKILKAAMHRNIAFAVLVHKTPVAPYHSVRLADRL